MSQLAPLISDLALILICAGVMTLVFAGVMTLIFKKLKQPLVLGYIVAGFLCSPHFAFTPSVVDEANIDLWSEIGVIFLLFALGLEFSIKKLLKVGSSAIISACTIILFMIIGKFGNHFGLHHYFIHDYHRCVGRLDVRLETNGLHLLRRNDCHVFHDHCV